MMRWTTALILGGAAWAVSHQVRRERRQYSFAGRTVLITGGSRGLGLELARQFVREQAQVALLARSVRELEQAVAELEGAGGRAVAIPCDVTRRQEVEEAVRSTLAEFQHIDVLVNNAGIIQVGPMDSMTDRDFDAAMEVHFQGPLNLMRAVVPHLRRQGGGRIVNIVSIGGKIAVPHLLPYSASKFALAGLSEGITSELRRDGIYVTTVFPGLMRTGSIYQARFKGRREEEFAWFGPTGSVPVLSMHSTRAAQRIVEACRHGTAEVVLGFPAKAATLFKELLPETTADLLALAARLLPSAPAEPSGPDQPGHEVRPGWLAPALTAPSDAAARRNLES